MDALPPMLSTKAMTSPKAGLAAPLTPVLLPVSSYFTVVASGATSLMLVVCWAAVRHAEVSGPRPSVTL
ncbi:hypothetical protein D3C78_1737880 [compost metagenome]